MADEQKVIPCPFCGSSRISDGEVIIEREDGKVAKQSECQECGALGPQAIVDGPDYGDIQAIKAWNRRAALSHASATAEECSVDDRGIEPDCEALSLMNGGLCKFGTHWGLDGDYLRCRACKRPQIASCAHMDFPHAAWCEVANDVEAHPWLTLIGLLKPIAIDQAIAAKRVDGNG